MGAGKRLQSRERCTTTTPLNCAIFRPHPQCAHLALLLLLLHNCGFSNPESRAAPAGTWMLAVFLRGYSKSSCSPFLLTLDCPEPRGSPAAGALLQHEQRSSFPTHPNLTFRKGFLAKFRFSSRACFP